VDAAGRLIVEDDFRPVRVVLRTAKGDERAWSVEVDSHAPLEGLLADLLQELKLVGGPADYELLSEGSIAEPVLVLKAKERSKVRVIRENKQ
jgi:hypothetical protein